MLGRGVEDTDAGAGDGVMTSPLTVPVVVAASEAVTVGAPAGPEARGELTFTGRKVAAMTTGTRRWWAAK